METLGSTQCETINADGGTSYSDNSRARRTPSPDSVLKRNPIPIRFRIATHPGWVAPVRDPAPIILWFQNAI